MTYTVTHDVKAPVNSIAVAANRVLDGHADELSEPVRADVVRISCLSGQIVKMIADLLTATKILSQPEPVVRVDLAAVIAEAVEVLQPQIAARGIRVEVTTPLPVVPGQANKLRHVFLNLIGNAIRFVPLETEMVEISAAQEDGCVVVAVRDNGGGIPAKYHESIFGMFRRVTGTDGDGGGSGIGLAIVKRIVEAHGGKVWLESVPGRGSAFRIRVPAS